MKLADLIKEATIDREEIISELAVLLGYTRPFNDLPSGVTANEIIDFAIEAFKLQQDSNGLQNIFMRLQRLSNEGPKPDQLTAPIQDLEYFEDTLVGKMPGFKTVVDAYRGMAAVGEIYKDTVGEVIQIYMLLSAFSEAALGKHMAGMKHENAAFKTGMAKAALKHLGLAAKEW